jgi:hypothetical protein
MGASWTCCLRPGSVGASACRGIAGGEQVVNTAGNTDRRLDAAEHFDPSGAQAGLPFISRATASIGPAPPSGRRAVRPPGGGAGARIVRCGPARLADLAASTSAGAGTVAAPSAITCMGALAGELAAA